MLYIGKRPCYSKCYDRKNEEGRSWVENNIDVCCHRNLDHDQTVLLRTFAYDRPGPMPCESGSCFFQQEQYRRPPAVMFRPAPGMIAETALPPRIVTAISPVSSCMSATTV